MRRRQYFRFLQNKWFYCLKKSCFWEFWFKHSLLCCTVNPDHFSRRASTLFNLITQRKKIQFPCRNPLFHNYQPEIFYKNHIFAFYRFLSPCLVCYSNAEQLLADLIKICRRQIPLLIHNDTFWSICIWNFYFKVFKNLIFSFWKYTIKMCANRDERDLRNAEFKFPGGTSLKAHKISIKINLLKNKKKYNL